MLRRLLVIVALVGVLSPGALAAHSPDMGLNDLHAPAPGAGPAGGLSAWVETPVLRLFGWVV